MSTNLGGIIAHHSTMTLDVGDSRAFVLAALQGRTKPKKRSADVSTSDVKTKPSTKKQATKKPKPAPAAAAEPPVEEIKRLRQDTIQWKLLSAQPEDFGDSFGDEAPASEDEKKPAKKPARKAKTDPMANLFDNEGGMMMLEEVDGVDVVWEEDGKGGKKAILVVSPAFASRRAAFPYACCARLQEAKAKASKQAAQSSAVKEQKVEPTATTKTEKPKNKKRKRSELEAKESPEEDKVAGAETSPKDAAESLFPAEEDLMEGVQASEEEEDEEAESGAEDEPSAKTLNTYERAKDVEFDGKHLPHRPDPPKLSPSPQSDALLPEWKSMPIHPLLKKGLYKLGFTKPTEIQKQAIPVAVNGSPASEEEGHESDEDMEDAQGEKRLRDVVGVAETVSLPLKQLVTPC